MSPLERWGLWLTSTPTTVSGIAYLWMKYFLESSDPWAVINHPLEPLALKTHILISPFFVFVLGAVVLKHGIAQLRNGAHGRRPSGLVLLASTAPMIITGYAIQIVTSEVAAQFLSLLHILSSLAFGVALVLHTVQAEVLGSERVSADTGSTTNRGNPRRQSPSTIRGTAD
jgi:hypothetical protein